MRTLIDFDDAPVIAVPTAAGPRHAVLVEGPQGWGEFSPPPGADDALAARWLTAAMEPSTVGWPDAVRGRVPVDDGTRRPTVAAGDVEAAVARIADLRAEDIEFVLLECRDPAAARSVRRRADVPIAVDAALLLADPQCADLAVLRCGPSGGVRRAMRRAEKLGLPVVVQFTGTTSIGLAADVALAAALPQLLFACGPVPGWLAEADVVSEARSLIPRDAHLPAAPMPAAPDPVRLQRFAVTDAETVEHWRGLLRRAAAIL
ncbi:MULTISPECIES: O-succinylbenzoate-CoA synthase [Mycobacteriaceae]|uniref:O-succinylbenzoate-CoA synthase n=1 Tax=Mycolicibacterium parafortuitum TaxID=39692 RepID=A0ACC6MLH2_MYCPF|nr:MULTISPECIES: O-succinylbenzoate-CoA synthase [Mycobacteriaceae]MDZ5087856.1 O-succinylbenzoate-CoA synthase [Mycolicibacterium parafortuitum]GFM19131.1 O-succinylbenzoate-CoA synthase [Mycobacterium sp. PO1]GFM22501.1 O-succinylbenzoate-CoA synthase [Mycobacterium sp. PO2]